MRVGYTFGYRRLRPEWATIAQLHDKLYSALSCKGRKRHARRWARELRTALDSIGHPSAHLVRLSRSLVYQVEGDLSSAIRECERVKRAIESYFEKTPTSTAAGFFAMVGFYDERLYERLAHLYLAAKQPNEAYETLLSASSFCTRAYP